jgi:hypothetical protein
MKDYAKMVLDPRRELREMLVTKKSLNCDACLTMNVTCLKMNVENVQKTSKDELSRKTTLASCVKTQEYYMKPSATWQQTAIG